MKTILFSILNEIRRALYVIYKAGYNAIYNDAIEHAGYLAFLGLLALFPFLVLLVYLSGIFGRADAGGEFILLISNVLPPYVIDALKPRANEIASGVPSQSLVALSIIGAIWTSSSFVEGFRMVLNKAYKVHTPPNYWFRRLLSIIQLLVFIMLIIIGTAFLVFFPILEEILGRFFGNEYFDPLISDIYFLISFFIVFITVASIYYILPNIKLSFLEVIPGAFLAIFLWSTAAKTFSNYLASFDNVNLVYGSLAGIIASLIFLYIINIIFIYGAEFNYLLKHVYFSGSSNVNSRKSTAGILKRKKLKIK